MKLCFVYEYYHPHVGGGELLLKHMAEGMAARGHECTVVTSRLPGTARRESINGVTIRRVRVPRRGDRYWFTLLGVPAVLAEASRADIIHAPTYNGAIPSWLAGRGRHKPVVLHPFEVLGPLWMNLGVNPVSALMFRSFEAAVLRLPFDRYGCISQHTRQALIKHGVPPERAELVYPGIDYRLFDAGNGGGTEARAQLRREHGIGDQDFLCLYSGRPGFVKGVEFLVQAIPEIRRRVAPARFMFLLSRQPEQKYREVSAALSRFGADVIVRDPVPRRRLPQYFAAADCVIVPSINEGFGFTAVEACAMGTPVVASAAGSLPEVISGKYRLVEPRSATAIAAGIEKVFAGDVETSEPKRFDWDDAIERHLAICEQLLAQRAGASATAGRQEAAR